MAIESPSRRGPNEIVRRMKKSYLDPSTFRQYRHICGLTMEHVAELYGRSRTTVAEWERGDRPIPKGVAVTLEGAARVLNVAWGAMANWRYYE